MGAGRVPCQDVWEPGTGGWSAGGHRSVGATASPGGGVFTRGEAVSGCRAAWPPPPPLWRVPWRCVRGAGRAPAGVRPLPSPTHSAGAMRPGAQLRGLLSAGSAATPQPLATASLLSGPIDWPTLDMSSKQSHDSWPFASDFLSPSVVLLRLIRGVANTRPSPLPVAGRCPASGPHAVHPSTVRMFFPPSAPETNAAVALHGVRSFGRGPGSVAAGPRGCGSRGCGSRGCRSRGCRSRGCRVTWLSASRCRRLCSRGRDFPPPILRSGASSCKQSGLPGFPDLAWRPVHRSF